MPDIPKMDPNAVVSNDVHPEAFALEEPAAEYWTAERMAAARPVAIKRERPPVDEAPLPATRNSRNRWQAGEPHRPDHLELDEFIAPAVAMDVAPVGAVAIFPYCAIGKLFLRIGGADQYATAFVVGGRSIVTAGHCVFSDTARAWADKVAFAPRFANGPAGGLWSAVSLFTLAGWAGQVPNARSYDMGGALLDHPIGPQTGTFGWLANIPPAQGPFHAVGYPTQWVSPQYPFDGSRMWRCVGGQIAATPGMLRMANNMTEGASGGPWLITRNGNIYVNGLNSFRLSDEPEALASPYFGQGFVNLMARLTT